NTQGIGARLIVVAGGVPQVVEQVPTRGFQSSVDPRPHFGLGTNGVVDSLTVIWPDQRVQVLRRLGGDGMVTLTQDSAKGTWTPAPRPTPLFTNVTASSGVT